MKKNDSLMTFPCHFPIKIFGVQTETFAAEIMAIAKKYYAERDLSMRSRNSQHGNYLSLTLTVYAQEQDTLDRLYKAIHKHPDIKMVL